jgi:gamma-glutamylcyclotransferase (GGCT)/AIG2-like uncharacterized protein YtfP
VDRCLWSGEVSHNIIIEICGYAVGISTVSRNTGVEAYLGRTIYKRYLLISGCGYAKMAHMSKLLFVYGTLMQGMRNHQYLEKATLRGPAQTKPEYELVTNGSIPAAKPGSESVKGEVYEVDDEMLASLDVLEEVQSDLYDRTEIELADGTKAIAYLGGDRMFATDIWEHVPNGDYKALVESQQKTA